MRRGLVLGVLVVAVLAVHGSAQQVPPVPTGVPTVEVPGVPPPVPPGPSQPAVPTQEVPSPAAPSNAPEQVMWALAASYLLQFMKKSKWFSFLTDDSSARVKSSFGFLMAVLTTAGIHVAVTGSPFDGTGAGITITGVTFAGLKDVLFQWASQQGFYDLVIRRQT